ncbi:MAG: LptF/LptG family permease [Bacteroidales bacterium]|nr:LptF/LptG family permease [Bacteroidales bacterium]
MKKVHKFVLKSFIGPLILTFFIVLIIQILQFLWLYIDELAGKGLELGIMAELLFQFTLVFVPTALPLAILLASLMTFGNLGEHMELTALKSSGIPLQKIMQPLIVLIIFVSIASFFFSNNVLPYSNRKSRTLLYDIRNKRPELNIQAGSFYNGIDGFSIKIGEKDPETTLLKRILIHDHRDNRGNINVIYGDSGYMRITPDKSGLVMTLYNGYSYTEMSETGKTESERTYPFRRDSFEEQTVVIELAGFDLIRSDDNIFGSHSAMLNIVELTEQIDSLNQRYLIRQESSFRDFNQTYLYQGRNYGVIFLPDTIQVPEFIVSTTFDTLTTSMKNIALSSSLENLKEAARALDQKSGALHNEIKNIKRYEVDWHKKLTLSFACLVFFFIGAPLGAIIRKGGLGTPSVISVLFFVIYYVISMSGEKLVKENQMSSIGGMWLASFILLPIGIMLTYMATTDSVVMNTETYTLFFRKIGARLSSWAGLRPK